MSTYEYYKVCSENLRQKPNLVTKHAADIYHTSVTSKIQ